ncbi:solute carrier family 15 member 2-like [Dromiciops gliroides]|uniref:solute carrier family 15 member 2-like n=1 Tax=Dromiciops gliroides TaxID=33562 RepID=UPI001CC41BF5|nr:solute carrier family 15 member 2-like [Dromiciops gliroides]
MDEERLVCSCASCRLKIISCVSVYGNPFLMSMVKISDTNYPLNIVFILINEFCERFSTGGTTAVITLYMVYFLRWNENTSTATYHLFNGLNFLVSIVGAIIADSWLGSYNTIVTGHILCMMGHMILILSSVPIKGGQLIHLILFMSGFSLIALGSGVIKPCVVTFIGDQFEEEHTEERRKLFSIMYLIVNLAFLISTIFMPLLRADISCFGGNCYMLVFGVSGLFQLSAVVVFSFGSGMYKIIPPEGDIIFKVCKCVWFAISNRLKHRSSDIPKREHWLDWAAEEYPKQLILEVKALTRVLFLYIPLPMFWALFHQQGSRWTLQATRLNGNMGYFVIKPDQVQLLNPFLILILIPTFDLIIYPLIKMCKINLKPITKMVIGMILTALAFVAAAILQFNVDRMAPAKPADRESFLQIVNLAKSDVKTIMQSNQGDTLLTKPVRSFQQTPRYSKLLLNTESQLFQFQLQSSSSSVRNEHMVEEKSRYSLVIHGDGNRVSSILMKDMGTKPANGMAAVRFVNTLDKEVNISLGKGGILNVGENYSISSYRTLERGEYRYVPCRTYDEEFYLDLGLLDFGAAYTVFIVKKSGKGPWAWKTKNIPANKVSILWQMPQYVLITAGEVMFSVTSFEFTYTEAPPSMKSVLQAARLLTVSIGNFIVLIVAKSVFLIQWIEFILFSGLLFVVCFIFSIMGHYYIPTNQGKKKNQKEFPEVESGDLLVTQQL